MISTETASFTKQKPIKAKRGINKEEGKKSSAGGISGHFQHVSASNFYIQGLKGSSTRRGQFAVRDRLIAHIYRME